MNRINITIPGHPVAKARPRVTRFGTYTPETTRTYHELIQVYARQAMAGEPPIEKECPVRLYVNVFRKCQLVNRPDIDNYCKSIMDGLNGIVWEDDSSVVELRAYKFQDKDEHISVVVERLRGD